MELKKLYKRATNGNIQEWQIFIEGNQFWTVHGKVGGKLITDKPTTCTPKNVGRSNETTGEEQAMLEASAKWTKQKEKGHYFENIQDVDNDSYFKVMLAKSYKDYKDRMKFDGALLSPKLDGIRYVNRQAVAHSRNGKPLGGAEYIRNRMKELMTRYPDTITDGELYNHTFKDDFNSLVSLIKRDANKLSKQKVLDIKKYLQYHIYDIPRFNGLTEKDPYITRFEAFWKVIDEEFPDLKDVLKKVPYIPVSSHEDIQKGYEKFIEEGYEGAIVRFNTKYENKRTWNLLKVKEFMDEEFKIVEILEGTGNKAGTAGSMTVEKDDGTRFNANIKGGYKFYDEIWKNNLDLIGKTATVQFFQYTEYGIPRFPYVIKISREDYE